VDVRLQHADAAAYRALHALRQQALEHAVRFRILVRDGDHSLLSEASAETIGGAEQQAFRLGREHRATRGAWITVERPATTLAARQHLMSCPLRSLSVALARMRQMIEHGEMTG
jgi:hypothetical protein